jgi:DcmR-like sensory protein
MTETAVATPTLQLRRGDHVCVFCRGGNQRDELLLPFLVDGLSAGDKCLAVLDTGEPAEILDALGPAAAGTGPTDRLRVLSSRDVYLTQRGFDMEGMLSSRPDAPISLCLYEVDRFDAEVIVGVLRTHPKAVLAGTVVDNPFSIEPDEFLRQRT